MAGRLKFRIWEVEGLYYPWSENKDADQLRGYREADLRLCFRICKKPVFSRRGSYTLPVFKLIPLASSELKSMKLQHIFIAFDVMIYSVTDRGGFLKLSSMNRWVYFLRSRPMLL